MEGRTWTESLGVGVGVATDVFLTGRVLTKALVLVGFCSCLTLVVALGLIITEGETVTVGVIEAGAEFDGVTETVGEVEAVLDGNGAATKGQAGAIVQGWKSPENVQVNVVDGSHPPFSTAIRVTTPGVAGSRLQSTALAPQGIPSVPRKRIPLLVHGGAASMLPSLIAGPPVVVFWQGVMVAVT